MSHCPRWRTALVAAIAAGLVIASSPEARAQGSAFPAGGRPITIIVPYAPGGVTDTGARLMALGLEQELKTPVVVVNKPGAASQIGLSELLKSKPDGYTLSYVVLPTVVTHYVVPGRDVTYSRTSFQPIAMHHYVPQTISVGAANLITRSENVRSGSTWDTSAMVSSGAIFPSIEITVEFHDG